MTVATKRYPWQKNALKDWALQPRKPDSTKDKKTQSILFRVTPKFHLELKQLANIQDITLQDFIEHCCRKEVSTIVRKHQPKAK
jgi:predicted HicB family RNase H-like nuclease